MNSPSDAESAVSTSGTRRFNLVDSMILTAAASIAFLPPWGTFVADIPTKFRAWGEWLGHITGRRRLPEYYGIDLGPMLIKDVLNFGVGLLNGPLAAVTLAVFLLRLRQPRPDGSMLVRQPGFAACGAAILSVPVGMEVNYLGIPLTLCTTIATPIAMAWVVLAVTRRWSAERSWLDRLGRLVGCGWLVGAACVVIERSL